MCCHGEIGNHAVNSDRGKHQRQRGKNAGAESSPARCVAMELPTISCSGRAPTQPEPGIAFHRGFAICRSRRRAEKPPRAQRSRSRWKGAARTGLALARPTNKVAMQGYRGPWRPIANARRDRSRPEYLFRLDIQQPDVDALADGIGHSRKLFARQTFSSVNHRDGRRMLVVAIVEETPALKSECASPAGYGGVTR